MRGKLVRNEQAKEHDPTLMSGGASSDSGFDIARELSPRRSTTHAQSIDDLVVEQLAHFSIDPESEAGRTLGRLAGHIYRSNIELHKLWELTVADLRTLDR